MHELVNGGCDFLAVRFSPTNLRTTVQFAAKMQKPSRMPPISDRFLPAMNMLPLRSVTRGSELYGPGIRG